MTQQQQPRQALVGKCMQHSKAHPDTLLYLLQIAKAQQTNDTRPTLETVFADVNETKAHVIINELLELGEIQETKNTVGQSLYLITLTCPPGCQKWGPNHELDPNDPNYKTNVLIAIANDTTLSFKARGIALFLLNNPEAKTSTRNIAEYSQVEERTSISTGLKELEEHDYLQHLSKYYARRHTTGKGGAA